MVTRQLLLSIATALLTLSPVPAFAGDYRSGETRVVIPSDETINDDLYISSGEVVVDGTVNGDVFAAGGQLRLNGTVTGDLFVAGGDINVAGIVNDDLRIAGGNISVGGKVGDDLLIFGGNAEVIETGEVIGDVRAGAGNLTLAGKSGNVHASVGSLRVASTATINGDLTYMSGEEATIESGATITGRIDRQVRPVGGWREAVTVGGIFPLVSLLMALLFLYLFPNKSARVTVDFRRRFGGNLLWGFLFVIAVPIAAFILLISLIGIPVAVGVLLLYPIFLYAGHLVSALALGSWIKNLWEREKEPRPNWLAAILGVVAVAILGLIPFVGWILGFLVFLAGLGALVRYDWDVVSRMRANKTL